MVRIWGILRRGDKIAHDTVMELTQNDLDEALEQICHTLDIPQPVVLGKHRNEYKQFYRTVFRPDDFIDALPFSRFEVEVLRDRKKKDAAAAASQYD